MRWQGWMVSVSYTHLCDLVKQETERIESRFLEPACGNGNFLAEVLSRKLTVVKNRYGKSPFDYERDVYKRQEVVRSRFLKLDSSHIEFVMECLHKNTTQVRNIKQYLLAVLFNAPTTMSNSYTCLLYTSRCV